MIQILLCLPSSSASGSVSVSECVALLTLCRPSCWLFILLRERTPAGDTENDCYIQKPEIKCEPRAFQAHRKREYLSVKCLIFEDTLAQAAWSAWNLAGGRVECWSSQVQVSAPIMLHSPPLFALSQPECGCICPSIYQRKEWESCRLVWPSGGGREKELGGRRVKSGTGPAWESARVVLIKYSKSWDST